MGIAIVPNPTPLDFSEPCYDSDCYYAQGEYLTWWPGTPPVQPLPPTETPTPVPIDEPPPVEPPTFFPIPTNTPTDSGDAPPSSPSPPPSSSPENPAPPPATPTYPPASGDNPLYSVIGNLLQGRPDRVEGTPLVITQPAPSPVPVLIVAGLAIAGVVAYAYFRR